jgi:urease accessory protein
MAKLSMVKALNLALHQEMERDPDVLVIGEDVGVDGGVFRVTEDLHRVFGGTRVIDSPLAEAGIIGASVGMAIYGLKPVCEIQFSGFAFQCFHQIENHTARYRQRTQVCVEPGGRAVIIDAVVLHPDLTDETFGSYESSVAVTAPDGTLLALDAQVLETTPQVRRAPTAFGTVYVVGGGFDEAMTAISPDLESRSEHTVDRRAYLAVTDLPNQVGWAVRIAGSDGGTLRAAIAAVTEQVEALRQCLKTSTAPGSVSSTSRLNINK